MQEALNENGYEGLKEYVRNHSKYNSDIETYFAWYEDSASERTPEDL